MKYYAFPDIHGRSDLLERALSFVYEENPDGGKIIFLGDYIDRGPDSPGVVDIVMNPPDSWEFVTLMGNHEQMFLDSFSSGYPYYDLNCVEQFEKSRFNLEEVANWFGKLKISHREGKNVFAHAAYDPITEDQKESYALWYRYSNTPYDEFLPEHGDLHLTHGHTPSKNGPDFYQYRTNLDTGAVFYGRFVIAEYESDVMGPVEFHEFLG